MGRESGRAGGEGRGQLAGGGRERKWGSACPGTLRFLPAVSSCLYSPAQGAQHSKETGRSGGSPLVGAAELNLKSLKTGGQGSWETSPPSASRGGCLRSEHEPLLGEPRPKPTPDLWFSQKTASLQVGMSPLQAALPGPDCPARLLSAAVSLLSDGSMAASLPPRPGLGLVLCSALRCAGQQTYHGTVAWLSHYFCRVPGGQRRRAAADPALAEPVAGQSWR